jgi:DNA-binding MarR family transcriptional regulator
MQWRSGSSRRTGRCFYLHLTKSGRRLIRDAFDYHSKNLEKIGFHASRLKLG